LSRLELIKQFKKKEPNLSHLEISNLIDIFCNSIKKGLKDNKKVELREFGTFFVKKIKEKYSSRNPKNGKLIYVPEKNKIRFKASKKLNKKIND
jgi:nucleoid DNA-binding protein